MATIIAHSIRTDNLNFHNRYRQHPTHFERCFGGRLAERREEAAEKIRRYQEEKAAYLNDKGRPEDLFGVKKKTARPQIEKNEIVAVYKAPCYNARQLWEQYEDENGSGCCSGVK